MGDKVKIHYNQRAKWTGKTDRHGKLYGDDLDEYYIVEFKDAKKSIPITAKKIGNRNTFYYDVKLPLVERQLRGLSYLTLNKIRELAKKGDS